MKALILGGADCVWRDVDASEALLGPEWWDVVIAVNDVGSHWPRTLDYWVSLHPNKFARWKKEREENGHPVGVVTICKYGSGQKHADRHIRHPYGGGSSGLLAVAAAMYLGAEKIVLCGVPMERTPHFDESTNHVRGRPWSSAQTHRKKWTKHAGDIMGLVKSMSMVYDPGERKWVPSFTRRLLGAPTPEWLEETSGEQAA